MKSFIITKINGKWDQNLISADEMDKKYLEQSTRDRAASGFKSVAVNWYELLAPRDKDIAVLNEITFDFQPSCGRVNILLILLFSPNKKTLSIKFWMLNVRKL